MMSKLPYAICGVSLASPASAANILGVRLGGFLLPWLDFGITPGKWTCISVR